MLRNYVTVAIRNLVQNRLYSIINIGGLAVGLAACMLILLFVRDELSYEKWLPNADRIATIESTFTVPGREVMAFAGTPGPIKPALDKDFSSDIVRSVRLFTRDQPVRIGDRQFIGSMTYADPGMFEVFDLPMVAGQREAALANNASVILSETTARKYFGSAPAVGSTITVDGTIGLTVVGVFRDIPANSHLRSMAAIALFDTERYKDKPWVAERWTSVNTQTYVLFRSRAAMAKVGAELKAFVDRNVVFEIPGITEPPSTFTRFELMPVLDIHLHANKPGYDNLGSYAAVLAFSGIALLILIIACINFVNLATARAMKRAREVAMRKVVGATRGQLIRQHLGEAILTALIALVIAIAIVELVLSPFNSFLHKQLRFDLLGDPVLAATILGLILIVGAAGGLYPAIYLSRFKPAAVLRANQSSASGSARLRTALVVFQFAVSIALIICTAVIYTQTVYARTLDLGFREDNRLKLEGIDDMPSPQAQATLKAEVAALPGVRGVTLSSDAPPLQSNNNTLLYRTPTIDDEKLVMETLSVDVDFFPVYGVKPVAGRLFSADHESDFRPSQEVLETATEPRQSIVVNRAFVARIGAARPEDVIGTVMYEVNDDGKPMIQTTIIGVVPDLYLRSVRTLVTPLVYYAGKPDSDFDRLTIHIASGQLRETAAQVNAIWARLAPDVPIRTAFVDDDLRKQYDTDEQRGQIFAGFAVFAVLIACLGLIGLAAFAAERRTKEIGMRKVLGASVLDIVRLLVWQFSRPVLVANLIAWPVSFYVMQKWLAGFRYRIDLTSPLVLIGIFGGAALIALAIAWLTTAGHAYKVARANPGRALRVE
jgi:putative ABC transport system permease protein